VVFIGPKKQQMSGQGAYVRWFLPNGSMVALYVQVLTRGYSKSSVHLVVPRMSPVRFVEHTSALQTVAYVRLKVQIAPPVSLVTQSPN
jgi:hypothetical protein